MALSFHTSSPFEVKSSLPQDSRGFQGNGNAGMVRYHAHRIVCSRTYRGHPCAISVATASALQLANALHLLAYGTVAAGAVGIKLHSHRTRVEIAEIGLYLNHVLLPVGLDLHFTEAQRGPLLFHGVLPLDHLPAHRALSAARSRYVEAAGSYFCSVYSRTVRSAEKRVVNLSMLFRIRVTQAVG